MADASIDRLIEALAAKLPAKATRQTVELALRAAIDAVPKSQLRDKLLLKEGRWVRAILQRLQERIENEVQDSAAAVEQEAAEEEEAAEGVEGLAPGPGAAYRGIDGSSPKDCLVHCRQLLHEALVSVNPCARGAEAVQGLVSLLAPEAKGPAWQLDLATLGLVAQMVPTAATALGVVGQQETPAAWKRFQGLALSAPLHAKVGAAKEERVKEASARIGGTLALLACPRGARAALRIAIACCGFPGTAKRLARLAPGAVPLLCRAAEGGLGGDSTPTRGDLLALLSSLVFLHLAGRQGLVPKPQFSEARENIAAALSRGFDATPMLPELRRITEDLGSLPKSSRSLLKKVDVCIAERRASASVAVLLECVQSLAESLQPLHLQRLAGFSGLPVGEEEHTDVPAAAARARGDLFFEDTAGDVPLESLLAGGSAAALEAAAHAKKRTLGVLEGVEDLQGADVDEDADEEAPAVDMDPELPAFDEEATASPEGPKSSEAASPVEDARDAVKSGSKRLRRRSKGAA